MGVDAVIVSTGMARGLGWEKGRGSLCKGKVRVELFAV